MAGRTVTAAVGLNQGPSPARSAREEKAQLLFAAAQHLLMSWEVLHQEPSLHRCFPELLSSDSLAAQVQPRDLARPIRGMHKSQVRQGGKEAEVASVLVSVASVTSGDSSDAGSWPGE